MIRRAAGGDFLLITQTDHAAISRILAERVGNLRFTRPPADSPVFSAIGLHDAGWPLHDDAPTLNQRGLPLDVFETPREISLPVWAASADRAEATDPYAGLIVSLHQLSLSIYAASPPPDRREKFDVRKLHDQFAVNKFQHREIERQEQLRQRLGFNMEIPVKHGLADAGASGRDDQLRYDFRLLQAMDLLSLCVCCAKLPASETRDVLRSPAAKAIHLRLHKTLAGVLRVDPWPFDMKQFELQIPCRRVRGGPYASVEEFRGEYSAAKVQSFAVRLEK